MTVLLEALKIAYHSLISNKLRSLLTMLGVIIGVSAVITLVSMGEGAKTYIVGQIDNWGMGPNSILVHPGKENSHSLELSLTYEDAVVLKKKVKNLQYLMTEFVGRGRILFGKKEYKPGYTLGVSADYPFAYKQKAVEGKFFSQAEERRPQTASGDRPTVVRNFFGSYSPVGETIKLNGIGFTVIGILEEKGSRWARIWMTSPDPVHPGGTGARHEQDLGRYS